MNSFMNFLIGLSIQTHSFLNIDCMTEDRDIVCPWCEPWRVFVFDHVPLYVAIVFLFMSVSVCAYASVYVSGLVAAIMCNIPVSK